jgi:hypothetical protein
MRINRHGPVTRRACVLYWGTVLAKKTEGDEGTWPTRKRVGAGSEVGEIGPPLDKDCAMNSKLFDKTSLGSIALKNRFVRSATWEGMAHEDGACTPALVDVISELT